MNDVFTKPLLAVVLIGSDFGWFLCCPIEPFYAYVPGAAMNIPAIELERQIASMLYERAAQVVILERI